MQEVLKCIQFFSHACPVAQLKCVWWSPDTYCCCPEKPELCTFWACNGHKEVLHLCIIMGPNVFGHHQVARLKCVWWSPHTYCCSPEKNWPLNYAHSGCIMDTKKYYIHLCAIMGPNVFGHHPYLFGKIWIGLRADSEKTKCSSTFVLPAFKTHGWFNVGTLHPTMVKILKCFRLILTMVNIRS
jgi:hypothetical protein